MVNVILFFIPNAITVTYNRLNASLLNKSITFFPKKTKMVNTDVKLLDVTMSNITLTEKMCLPQYSNVSNGIIYENFNIYQGKKNIIFM